MRRKSIIEINRVKKKNSSLDNKEKKLIKTQSELEKELNIRSYSEYRIKDDDITTEYEDEDIETKMTRLVILKKKGGNIKDNINIKKKTKKKITSKLPKYAEGLSKLEAIDITRKIKKFFIKLKAKNISVHKKKLMFIFFQNVKKYIWKTYLKGIYNFLLSYSNNNKVIPNKSKNNSLLFSHSSQKKLKKIVKKNNNVKINMMIKKSAKNKGGEVEKILEKIKKENEMEKLRQQTKMSNNNILNEKLKRLDSLNKEEKDYLSKIKEQKKSIKNEIFLLKKKTNITEEGLSRIKENGISDIFSEKSQFDSTLLNKKESNKKKELNFNSSSKDISLNGSNALSIINAKDGNKENNENTLYSINSKESKNTNGKKSEINKDWMRKSLKNLRKSNIEKSEKAKSVKTSVKLSDLNIKKKNTGRASIFNLRRSQEKNEGFNIGEKAENSESNQYDKNYEKEDEDFSRSEYFINLPSEEQDKSMIDSAKKNLVEYDLFYKEQYLKNEVFIYDVGNIKDEEVEKIQKEVKKLDIKRKIIENKKLKGVMELKGLDTKEIQNKIDELNEEYKNLKKIEKEKIQLNIDNTEEFLNKGKLLNIYFQNKKERNYPRFALESSEEIGGKQIIDFKPLREEEVSRRYFDYYCCLEQRKKINRFLVYSRYMCKFLVENSIFDFISFSMIIINSFLMFISDPTDPNNLGNRADNYFLIFYALEVILKIITFTLFSAENAYLKDYWNILDFSIVIIGIISFNLEQFIDGRGKISGLSALKAFRILRPLKTLKRFKHLKKLVIALLASVGHLGETAIILFFFFLFFAVAGLQMWQGLFYRRCMNLHYGYFISSKFDEYMCSFDSNCEDLNSYGNTFICAKGYVNPDLGAINFDNIGNSLITVFVVVTLEGWSRIFTYVSKTFKDKIFINPIIIFIYFHAFIYLGAFYLINLFLAVTNSEFEHIERDRDKLTEKKSFFKLIQSKYDSKEKQKLEKKEREKQLKNQNNKKSNETLKELYNKINDEAFHIRKNKRDIPKVYSTVKDIYIMANNNPEELFLEKLRIEKEEKSLCLDIKRQQKDIEKLIKEKRIENEKSKTLKNTLKLKYTKSLGKKEQIKFDESKILDKYKTSGINIVSNNNGSESFNENNGNYLTKKKENNIIKDNLNIELTELLKKANKINFRIIEMSINDTEKYIVDKIINLAKIFMKNKEEQNKVKIIKEKQNENKKINEITFFEDADFEIQYKKLKKLKKEKFQKEQKRKMTHIKKRLDKSNSTSNRFKEKSYSRINYKLKNRNSIKDIGQYSEKFLNKELSFIDDLSLSNLTEKSENMNSNLLLQVNVSVKNK